MRISFVVPVYNASKYLDSCVCSILNQSYADIELLLVDDGSTDGSQGLCDQYAQKDERVRVFHKENGGVHTARNLGLQKASGEYVMFIDADDWIDTDIAQVAAEILTANLVDVLRGSYVREYEDHSAEKKNTFVSKQLCTGQACREVFRQTLGLIGQEMKYLENFNFLASTCTCVFRKKLLMEQKILFESREKYGSFEDGLFNLNVMAHAESFLYIDRCFYHYRKTNADACTAGYRNDFLNKQLFLFERLFKLAEQQSEPEFWEAYYNRVSFSVLELCLNAVRSNHSVKMQHQEIKSIVNSSLHKTALDKLDLRLLGIKWMVYYFFAKHRCVLPLAYLTRFINTYKKRG